MKRVHKHGTLGTIPNSTLAQHSHLGRLAQGEHSQNIAEVASSRRQDKVQTILAPPSRIGTSNSTSQ